MITIEMGSIIMLIFVMEKLRLWGLTGLHS